jgi:hypothetical protein
MIMTKRSWLRHVDRKEQAEGNNLFRPQGRIDVLQHDGQDDMDLQIQANVNIVGKHANLRRESQSSIPYLAGKHQPH